MQRGAHIAIVMTGAAILAAGISARGEQALRSISAMDGDAPVRAVSLQRSQQSPGLIAQGPELRDVSEAVEMASAPRPLELDIARVASQRDRQASDHVAEVATTEARAKMRTLSMSAIELPAEATVAASRGASGTAGGAATVKQAAATEVRLDRVVININFGGFGS